MGLRAPKVGDRAKPVGLHALPVAKRVRRDDDRAGGMQVAQNRRAADGVLRRRCRSRFEDDARENCCAAIGGDRAEHSGAHVVGLGHAKSVRAQRGQCDAHAGVTTGLRITGREARARGVVERRRSVHRASPAENDRGPPAELLPQFECRMGALHCCAPGLSGRQDAAPDRNEHVGIPRAHAVENAARTGGELGDDVPDPAPCETRCRLQDVRGRNGTRCDDVRTDVRDGRANPTAARRGKTPPDGGPRDGHEPERDRRCGNTAARCVRMRHGPSVPCAHRGRHHWTRRRCQATCVRTE